MLTRWWKAQLSTPVDPASVAVVRIGYGASVFAWAASYLASSDIYRHFIAPAFHFTYAGFSWVRPLPAVAMYAVFVALAMTSLCVALGVFYRVAMVATTLVFTYLFLLDRSLYQNHYYLVCLLGMLLSCMPAGRAFSLSKRQPTQLPGWCLLVLRFQLALPYVFGGLAKLNGDWLAGEPIGTMLAARADTHFLGSLLAEPATKYVFAYGGLLFDLLIVPAILWRKTRKPAFVAAVLFHALNFTLFNIDIFPALMLVCTTIFFDADWPRRFLKNSATPVGAPAPVSKRVNRALVAWMVVQCLVPLRQFAYDGPTAWHEQGHLFSWRMLIRRKVGSMGFFATDVKTSASGEVKAEEYLTQQQREKFLGSPDMVWQFAHYLGRRLSRESGHRVEIHVAAVISLNGREGESLIDPAVDLAAEPYRFTLAKPAWIRPLSPE